jgi:hypothetical protein
MFNKVYLNVGDALEVANDTASVIEDLVEHGIGYEIVADIRPVQDGFELFALSIRRQGKWPDDDHIHVLRQF